MKTLDLSKAFQLASGCQTTAAFLDPVQVSFVEGPEDIIHPHLRASLATHYVQLLEFCKDFKLPVSQASCLEILGLLDSEGTSKGRWLNGPTRAVVKSIQVELKSRLFLYVPYEDAAVFQEPLAGWGNVQDAFPGAIYDVEEAAKCLALHRSTASVFHAMRVVEHGLNALAVEFQVPFKNQSWNEVIERIEKAVRDVNKQPQKLENWKTDEQFFSEAAAQFMHFKNAWRNYSAHGHVKYTEEEAEAIFRHVRYFMAHLSKRLKEIPSNTTL